MLNKILVRYFAAANYVPLWQAMQQLTDQRQADTPDELWIVEHLPVYTLGQNGDTAHLINAGNIPIVRSDRGGQVTYHGPGQLVIYTLIDLQRRQLGIRRLVSILENSMIDLLAEFDLLATSRAEAPGVYIGSAKIGAVGLRIRKGCAYHGLSLNVNMDLSPFAGINPCGHIAMPVTQLKAWDIITTPFELAPRLVDKIEQRLDKSASTSSITDGDFSLN